MSKNCEVRQKTRKMATTGHPQVTQSLYEEQGDQLVTR